MWLRVTFLLGLAGALAACRGSREGPLLVQSAGTEASAPSNEPSPVDAAAPVDAAVPVDAVGTAATTGGPCDQAYARAFKVALHGQPAEVRLVRNPYFASNEPLGNDGDPCRSLGGTWRMAPGSLHPDFLRELKRGGGPELGDMLRACPVTFRFQDKVCAPCVAGAKRCPCSERHVSDWLFCQQ